VGIDPGTTTGVVLFDLEGNLLLTKSKKSFARSEINRVISGFGIPVIIASDMFPPSRIIERIASTFSAKLITPKKSLSRKEKNQIISSERWIELKRMCENRHEKDALAAALFAFSKIERLMRRVD
jgi:predicted RNase H-like nuclease (RuvC/YqgF family)